MYDTNNFYLLQEDYPTIDFINEMPKYISIKTAGSSKFGEYITGDYNGYKVMINRNKISFSNCSLARFKFGNNLETLSRGTTKEIIFQMEDELHLPIREANLTRLDLAQAIPVKHKPNLYLALLGESQYYIRLEQPNSINYQNNKRVKTFYNKTVEQIEKRKPLPEIYTNAQLLRYELRFISRLPEQFNLSKVPMSLLYDEQFYFMLVRRWREEYLNIKKISVNTEYLCPTGSSKNLLEQLASRSVLSIGQDKLFKLIKEWQESGEVNKKQAYDLRQAITRISMALDRHRSNELITELDKKIKDAARFC